MDEHLGQQPLADGPRMADVGQEEVVEVVRRLAVAGGYQGGLTSSGGVILWDAANRRRIGQLLTLTERFVASVAFAPDSRTLAAGWYGGIGGVIVWDIDPISWQRRACRIANHDLSREEWEQYIGPNFPYRSLCSELLEGKGGTLDIESTGGEGP